MIKRLSPEDEGVKLWDKELNRVYGELLQQLPKGDKSALKDSQQEWIRFRDRNLKLIQVAYGNAEGTMYHAFRRTEHQRSSSGKMATGKSW